MLPEVGARRPVSILMVVDLPAPLGPRKPKNWPGATLRLTFSTAVKSPNRRVRPEVEIAAVIASQRILERWTSPGRYLFNLIRICALIGDNQA